MTRLATLVALFVATLKALVTGVAYQSANMATQFGNRKINRKSYHIVGLSKLMRHIILAELGGLKQAEGTTGIPERTLRRSYQSEGVSQILWDLLLCRLPGHRDQLEALCPEGWGGTSRSARYEDMQIRASKSVMNSSGFFTEGLRLPGNKTSYTIVRKIDGHSRTASYEAREDHGKKVFIKTLLELPITPTKRIHSDIDELEVRFRREADSHSKLKEVARIAHVIDHNRLRFPNFPHEVPYLVQEYVDGLTFEQFIAKNRQGEIGGLGVESWFRIARQLLETLRQVHAAGVIHGDICPDNILFSNDEPVIVDFGQSFFFDTHFIKESDSSFSRQIEFVAPERRGKGKWSRPADVYSLGGVLLYMACESLPPKEEPDNHKLRILVFDAIRRRNPSLLDANIGIADVILRCLHNSIEDRSSSPGEVLELLSIYEQTTKGACLQVTGEIKSEISLIQKYAQRLESQELRIFLPFLLGDLRHMSRRLSDAFAGKFLSIVGDREEMILGLLRYLSLLDNGDAYFTLTVPKFWRDDNLGIDGRFIRFNTMLAQKGVTIRRVFLVTRAELKEGFTRKVFQSQIAALGNLTSDINTKAKEVEAGGYYTGFVVMNEKERDQLMLHGHHVGIAKIGKDCLALVFKANKKDGQIRRIELRKEIDPDEILAFFLKQLNASKPITEV